MYPESLTDLAEAANATPDVAALLLAGSWSTGCATEHSDVDVWVVSHVPPAQLPSVFRQPPPELDLACVQLRDFRALGAIDSDTEYQRYAMRWAQVLFDRTDGEVPRLREEKACLPEHVAARRAPGAVDAYLNNYYRALKNQRDGRKLEYLLDAAEAVDRYLTAVFVLHTRLRPYNKYVVHDLQMEPLTPDLTAEGLAPLLEAALGGQMSAHVTLFNLLEPVARAKQVGPVLDAWPAPMLSWMRTGTRAATTVADSQSHRELSVE